MIKVRSFDAINGTSFHGTTILATPQELHDVLGEPTTGNNDGEDKTNYEWWLKTVTGRAVTLYDWKEYRRIRMNEEIEWHIGGHSLEDTERAQDELTYMLSACRSHEV